MKDWTFTLEMELGNDAMRTVDDVADKLTQIAESLRRGIGRGQTVSIHDANGNNVGQFHWPKAS